MKIKKGLAQKIVDNTMGFLGKNINIMDHNGVIIGSGDKSRINTYHEAALKVIEMEKELILSKKEAEKLQGVKPGVNLPIKFNENIIGVVGITGKGKELSRYGAIVKNMVELMFQRDFLLKEIELENKARENYYQQLLGNYSKKDERFSDRARLFDVNRELDRVVMVIKTRPYDNKLMTSEIDMLYSLLNIENDQDIFFIRGENIVFVKSLETDDFKEQCSIIKSLAKLILIRLKKVFEKVEIGIGLILPGIKKLHLSYEGAKHALEVGERVYNCCDNEIYFLADLGYDYFLPYVSPDAVEYYLHHVLGKDITAIFNETDIGELIEALVENNFNISKTADKLFIHRNTLLYRLNKLEKITGLDPKSSKNIFALLLGYHLYLYKNK